MSINFETLSMEHGKAVMDIYNYYIQNSFAAYPDSPFPDQFFVKFLEIGKTHPAFIIKENEKIIGFCLLRPYNPFSVFNETAEITYFIDKDYTGKGVGIKALNKLEESARNMGIKRLMADISSRNTQSINFHKKNGFTECGRFDKIGKKFDTYFDVVWMQKVL